MNTAFTNGYHAFMTGKSKDANPHKDNEKEYSEWESGYKQAEYLHALAYPIQGF